MSEQVSFSAQVKISGGPTIPISVTLAPGAYVKLNVTVPTGGTATPVHVQPAAGLAQILIVTASSYIDAQDPSKKLAIEFGQLTSGNFAAISKAPIDLDGPLVVSGKGTLANVAPDWTMLRLTNDTSADISVDILACRDV